MEENTVSRQTPDQNSNIHLQKRISPLKIQMMAIDALKPYKNNARTHSKKQIAKIARSIKEIGFTVPVIIDETNTILAGHGRVLAAIELGMTEVPVILLSHMTKEEKRAYVISDNALADQGGWNNNILKIELQNISIENPDFDFTVTGLDTPRIDALMNGPTEVREDDPLDAIPVESVVPKQVKAGDLWQVGTHRVYCGDSLKQESFNILLDGKKADLVSIDPPFNLRVNGHVGGKGKIQHTEFVQASGEMSKAEFTDFLKTSFDLLAANSNDGSIHFVFIDWRHVAEITSAGDQAYTELKNICVWNKQLGAMGSFYRSQHEFVFVFKNGAAPHVNNIELGKHGRNRTNIWDYPGVHSHREDLKFHPTCKTVQMIADSIIDCSNRGAIVLDSFAGSGSTLLAAEKTKRKAYVIEYEPKYCDVILYRFEKMTGIKAVLIKGCLDVNEKLIPPPDAIPIADAVFDDSARGDAIHAVSGRKFNDIAAEKGISHGK